MSSSAGLSKLSTSKPERRAAGHIFDAFLSHASKDSKFAERLIQSLHAGGLKGWIDNSHVRFGALLRNELQSAIADSRVLVLLWSQTALQSRWVMAEIFTAFHLGRFIIPCVLDTTPLPQFLGNAAYLDRQRDKAGIAEKLCRAVRGAPDRANEVAPFIANDPPLLQSLTNGVAAGQYAVLATITTDLQKAIDANTHVNSALESVKQLFPLHPRVLNLAGYQCKNNYMMKHWDAIQAGRAPKDPLLDQGERYFFETLCVTPSDASAVNGLGNILFYERELDAAEFFHRRAIDLMKSAGASYEAAEHDLELVLRYKRPRVSNVIGPGALGMRG